MAATFGGLVRSILTTNTMSSKESNCIWTSSRRSVDPEWDKAQAEVKRQQKRQPKKATRSSDWANAKIEQLQSTKWIMTGASSRNRHALHCGPVITSSKAKHSKQAVEKKAPKLQTKEPPERCRQPASAVKSKIRLLAAVILQFCVYFSCSIVGRSVNTRLLLQGELNVLGFSKCVRKSHTFRWIFLRWRGRIWHWTVATLRRVFF